MMKITKGSGNVYKDIGSANPEAMLAKAQLVSRIASIIETRGLTQREAAEIIGMPQPKLSNVLRGQFRGVSEAKLMDCLLRLGNDVQIVVKPTKRSASMGSLSVAFA
jgi:predicted XRE-type DNA-binding protein